MPSYTVEEAAQRLPELLAQAVDGADVVITRPHEDPVRLVAGQEDPIPRDSPMTQADIEWLRAHRVKLAHPVDFTSVLREMRDEDP